jgi:thymidylate synthase (FAD)
MKVVNASYEIMGNVDGIQMLKNIEKIARTCYKSEDKITDDSYIKMIRSLVERKHEAMLEHASVTVKLVCDRGVSHELVRHRLASFAQESTRYCNYGHDNEITVIKPCFWEEGSPMYFRWHSQCGEAEQVYLDMLKNGAQPQEARSVLPNSLKTEINITMNLREWRHFFKLRACGATGKPHPQMLEIAVPMLKEFQNLIPIIFDDLKPMEVI